MQSSFSTKLNVQNYVKREAKLFDRVIMGTRDDTQPYRQNYYHKEKMRAEPNTKWLVSHPRAEGEKSWTHIWQAELWREAIARKKEFLIVTDPQWIMQRATENYDQKTDQMINANRIGGVPRELAWLIENGYTFMQRKEKGMNNKERTVWVAFPTENTPNEPIINYDYFKPEKDPIVIGIIQEGFAKPVFGKPWEKLPDSGIIGKARWVYDKRHSSELRKSVRKNTKTIQKYETLTAETKTETITEPRPPSPDITELQLIPRQRFFQKSETPVEAKEIKEEHSDLEKRDSGDLQVKEKEKKRSYAAVVNNSASKTTISSKKLPKKIPVTSEPFSKTELVTETVIKPKKTKHIAGWSGPTEEEVFDFNNPFDGLSIEEGTERKAKSSLKKGSSAKTEIKLNLEKIVNDYLQNFIVENKEEIINQITKTVEGSLYYKKDQVSALKNLIQDHLTIVHKSSGCCFYSKKLAYLEFDDDSFKQELANKNKKKNYK